MKTNTWNCSDCTLENSNTDQCSACGLHMKDNKDYTNSDAKREVSKYENIYVNIYVCMYACLYACIYIYICI
jgi:methionyl-tRNA synthetase